MHFDGLKVKITVKLKGRNEEAMRIKRFIGKVLSGVLCMGLLLAFVDESVIRQIVGRESGMPGIVLSGLIGSVTLIPAFAAYPAAAELLRVTGGYAQVTMLITSLMMVGIVTLPMEMRFFGVKAAVWRNALGLLYSFALALVMGAIYGGV